MRKWLKAHTQRYMVRPIVYKTFTRFIYALAAALLWNRFLNTQGFYPMRHAYTIIGCLFLALAWANYLSLDGVELPRLPKAKLLPLDENTRTPDPFAGESADVEQEAVTFDDLDEEDRAACSLFANIICAAVFFIWSAV